MILTSIVVTNFRSLRHVTVSLDPVTILVGPNGCGKSNLLQSLRFFYEQSYPITETTFYNRNTTEPLTVALTFSDLTLGERETFAPYLEGDTLSVLKEAHWNQGTAIAKYYGMRDRCPDFVGIRQLTGRPKTQGYNALVDAGQHAGLERVTRVEDVEPALASWEEANPDQCQRARDDGQFFGWPAVGQGRIDRFSKWLYIPAVREAGSEGADAKGSALKELVDIFLRPKLAQHPALQALQVEVNSKLQDILDPSKITELQNLSQELTTRLAALSPGTSVAVGWRDEGNFQLRLPITGTDISEGQFSGPVEHAGHGTQRAFLIAILQYLVEARITSQAEPDAVPPHILLAIEEPELYLHPSRARLMSRVLQQLSESDDSGRRIQSVFATHSPLFVDLSRFNSVRKGYRSPGTEPDAPWISEFVQARLEDVASDLATAFMRPPGDYSSTSLLARLATIMTQAIAEGFFANLVVLVEGEEDRALIVAEARRTHVDLEALGVAVLSVGGKTNLDRPFVVFSRLGIASYIVFDGDADKPQEAHPETNEALLRLANETPERFPDTHVSSRITCATHNLPYTVANEIGSTFSQTLTAVANEYSYDSVTQAQKNPLVIAETLTRCHASGRSSATLESIVRTFLQLLPPELRKMIDAQSSAQNVCRSAVAQGDLFAEALGS